MSNFEEILSKMYDLCLRTISSKKNSFKKLSDQTEVIIYQFAYINKQTCNF